MKCRRQEKKYQQCPESIFFNYLFPCLFSVAVLLLFYFALQFLTQLSTWGHADSGWTSVNIWHLYSAKIQKESEIAAPHSILKNWSRIIKRHHCKIWRRIHTNRRQTLQTKLKIHLHLDLSSIWSPHYNEINEKKFQA